MPKESTKKVPKHRFTPGFRKKGKVKIKDKQTGEERWVSGKKGLVIGDDGNPTSKVTRPQPTYERPHKPVHNSRRPKDSHKPKDS